MALGIADQDGAEPSSNSFSAHNFHRLSAYLPKKFPRPEETDLYKTFGKILDEHPVALPEMLSAFIYHSELPKQVRIRLSKLRLDQTLLEKII